MRLTNDMILWSEIDRIPKRREIQADIRYYLNQKLNGYSKKE